MDDERTNGSRNGKHSSSYAAAAGVSTHDGVGVNTPADSGVNKAQSASAVEPASVAGEIDVKKVEGRKGGAARTLMLAVAFFVGIILIGGLATYFLFLRGSGAQVVKTNIKNQPAPGQPLSVSDTQLTAEAIARARSQVAPSPTPSTPSAPGANTQAVVQQPGEQPVVPVKVGTTTLNANANGGTDAAVVHPADGVAGTVNANANANTSANANANAGTSRAPSGGGAQARVEATRAPSRANEQRSIVFGEEKERSGSNEAASSNQGREQSRPVRAGFAMRNEDGVGASEFIPVRPPFGTLLPVRTLGAIYTLRSGALVRMELTRDSSGPGWKLPRRTIIVGTLRGGQNDRAYVSVVGYIDSATGKLVTFGGSLLGSDAGEGIRGARQRVGSRWARIFGTIANRGFELAQSALAGRGGATVVLADAGRPQIDALSSNGDRAEFVAVKAGSMGYVSVNELPKEIQGVDALEEMNPDALAQLLNSGANTGTGLTDEEVAQIISNGSPAQIRAAMPRMNDEMRRIAEQVISQTDR
jgi:hypothetical protein